MAGMASPDLRARGHMKAQRLGAEEGGLDEEDAGLVGERRLDGFPAADAKPPSPKGVVAATTHSRRNVHYLGIGILVAILLAILVWLLGTSPTAATPGVLLRLATWNIAAINNNPFEYWITHDDPAYNRLMQDVEAFLDKPGDEDVALSEVFHNDWVDELVELMQKEGWEEVEAAHTEFKQKYLKRKIASEFLKDKDIGLKRLVSMPDRMTNTINLASGSTACRPAVDNCYKKQFSNLQDWWKQWKHFMFEEKMLASDGEKKRACDLITKISNAKYPALSDEEAKMSKPLSLFSQAAFDAITVHMLSTIANGRHKSRWQSLRKEMCHALNDNKASRTLEILSSSLYSGSDIIFLQEVAGAFVDMMRQSDLAQYFQVLATDSKRDQNSVILLRKSRFDVNTVHDLTEDFHGYLDASAGVAHGDLITVSVEGPSASFLLASFHGDTNGQQTIPVVKAMHKLSERPDLKGFHFIFGLDANTYAVKKPKYQYVMEFAAEYNKLGYTSCWGDKPNPANHTTFNARTYLQPQLNKAVRFSDLDAPDSGDKNPKDFILFNKGVYSVQRTWKDNTGKGTYKEGMVFPTLAFPSDHGVLATELLQI